jgi:hypothetical protein
VDIGPASEALFCEALSSCKTVFWNGPMGKFEVRWRLLLLHHATLLCEYYRCRLRPPGQHAMPE